MMNFFRRNTPTKQEPAARTNPETYEAMMFRIQREIGFLRMAEDEALRSNSRNKDELRNEDYPSH